MRVCFFRTVICGTEPGDVKNHPARVYIIAQAVVAAWIRHYMTVWDRRQQPPVGEEKKDLFSDMDHFTWVILPLGWKGIKSRSGAHIHWGIIVPGTAVVGSG